MDARNQMLKLPEGLPMSRLSTCITFVLLYKVLSPCTKTQIPFAPHIVDLGDPVARDEFKKSGRRKFPVLRDEGRAVTVPESTAYTVPRAALPGPSKLIRGSGAGRPGAGGDRFYDLHLHVPMQKVVGDKLRPARCHDPLGVDQAWSNAHRIAHRGQRKWLPGVGPSGHFTMATARPVRHCLHESNDAAREGVSAVSAYLDRLTKRPLYARALTEAQPYLRVPR